MRQNIFSGAVWEEKVGYSRAVKINNQVFISGTTAVDEEGNIAGENDPYLQAKFIFQMIKKALQQAGASMKDVVRTRSFVTDIAKWQEIGRAHAEVFQHIRPASTMVEVKALIQPGLLVEIEVDAVINSSE
jgi:enamine deaminase RidA (YjgF/YER057c/UK114 family)